MDNKNNSGSRINHQFLMLLTHMRNTINQNYSFMSCLTSMSTCCVAIFISLAICSCIYHDKLPSPRAKNQTKWPIVTFTGQSTIVKLDIYFSLDEVLTAYAKNKRMRTALLRKMPPLQPVHQLHFVLGPNWGQKIEYNR